MDKHQKKHEQKPKKDSKDKKIEDLTDSLKRLQAEFENYKKRDQKERLEFTKYSNAELINQLLPIIDTFEIALKSTKDKEKFLKGIEMIFTQFNSTFESFGLRPIKALGERFDPFRHEVLMKEESDKEEDTILDEMQKGYMLHDKVLRHSKVKISSKQKEAKKENVSKS